MILLDTNVVSELMKVLPDRQVGNWLKTIVNHPLATTAISIFEIEYGISRLPDGKRKQGLAARFARLAGTMIIWPLDDAAAYKAGQFQADRITAGYTPKVADMMIAGIAASLGASLATRNVRDFETLPFALIDPWCVR